MAIGIAVGRYLPISWPWWSLCLGVLLIISLLGRSTATAVLHLAMIAAGALLYQQTYLFPSTHLAFLTYQEQRQVRVVEGVVDSDVQLKPTPFETTKQVFELRVVQVKRSDTLQKAEGRLLVQFFAPLSVCYGDHLILEGSLYKVTDRPGQSFSYQQYLEEHGLFFNFSVGKRRQIQRLSQGEGNWLIASALTMKKRGQAILSRYLDPFEDGIIQAMVLGDRSAMTKDVYALFSKTGTSHILAISGMNMTIISAIILFLLKTMRVARAWQFILTGLFLLFYALLSGWSPSVVRSVLMAVVLLGSYVIEDEAETMNSLGLAALMLFMFNPSNLFDVGFQLSFLSVAMIVSSQGRLQPIILRYCQDKWQQYLALALTVSLIAWVAVAGLIAYEFRMVTPVGIIANIPIVVLADLIILLSLGLIVTGMICPWLAPAFAGSLKLIFHFTLWLTAFFAQLPGAYTYLPPIEIIYVFSYYWILLIVYLVIVIKVFPNSQLIEK